MKKRLLNVSLFFVIALMTACGGSALSNKSKRTVEDLMDGYVKAYTKADVEIAKEIFPPYYVEYAKDRLTTENLEKSLENAKSRYGEDFNIEYKITETTKLTDEELEELNNKIKNNYNADVDAKECYVYDGTITFKGSNREDKDSLKSIAYCSYNGSWYLVDR